MTIQELKKLIRKLPDDMEVFMPFDAENLVTVCKENSEIIEIDISEDDNEPTYTETVLLLLPCGCSDEVEIGEINSQPELN